MKILRTYFEKKNTQNGRSVAFKLKKMSKEFENYDIKNIKPSFLYFIIFVGN